MHGMNGRFNAILLARAELETARCLLDVLVGQTEDGLAEDAAHDLADTDWPHTWFLVERDQPACHIRLQGSGIDVRGCKSAGALGQCIAQFI